VTPDEVLDLLTLIAVRDNRTVGRTTAVVWHEDIGDLNFADCREAVGRHFRESTDWLMPATIRRLVKAIRAERLEGFQYVPVEGDDHTPVYLANLRAQRAAVADGVRPAAPPALPASEPRAEAVRELVAGVFPEPPAADELPARLAAETTVETRRRKAVEAFGYLLTIDSDAARSAMDRAGEQLGADADRDEVAILAATLTDAAPLPPARPDKATADLLAAQGCPNGCPLGEHVKPCFYVGAS
jgi:hypothetical protein